MKTIKKYLIRKFLPEFKTKIDEVIFRQAETVEDYINCFKLLYETYIDSGFLRQQQIPMRIVKQHYNKGTRLFLAEKDNTIIYTASIFTDEESGLPVDQGFKTEIDKLRNKGRTVIEVGGLATHKNHRYNNKSIPMIGNRLCFLYSIHTLKANDMVVTIHPKYLKIYQDILLFEKIGSKDTFSYVNNNPVVAMRVNLDTIKERCKKVYGKKSNIYKFFFNSIIDFSTINKRDSVDGIKYGEELINHIISRNRRQND